ncbi:DUF2796 domain-containing protein [Marinobacterium maritimum]|uniref:DUF2796 domain-containing protein n=1 Tax=Marinobacterium maritimum TaxID=500162 RepID=A0ABP3T7S5_9GAMM
MRLPLRILLTALLPIQNLMAAGVHQHGAAQLDMVIEPPLMAISFSSPLANLTGFEHRPSSDAEQQSWDDTLAQLQRAEELIQLSAEADCSLSRVDLHLPFTAKSRIQSNEHEHEHEHEHAHDDVSQNSHADLMAEYQYLCANSPALKVLQLPLMQRFPAIELLEVQMVTPSGQHQRTLTAKQTGLQLP